MLFEINKLYYVKVCFLNQGLLTLSIKSRVPYTVYKGTRQQLAFRWYQHVIPNKNRTMNLSNSYKIKHCTHLPVLHLSPSNPSKHPWRQVPLTWWQVSRLLQWPQDIEQFFPNVCELQPVWTRCVEIEYLYIYIHFVVFLNNKMLSLWLHAIWIH